MVPSYKLATQSCKKHKKTLANFPTAKNVLDALQHASIPSTQEDPVTRRLTESTKNFISEPTSIEQVRDSHYQNQRELEEAENVKKKVNAKDNSKPNYDTEAEISDQPTAAQMSQQTIYGDRTGLVPFHDLIGIFDFGEFYTNFTP